MNASVQQWFDDGRSLEGVVVAERSARRRAGDAKPGRRALMVSIGATVAMTVVLVAFTLQATSSYLPVFPTLVP